MLYEFSAPMPYFKEHIDKLSEISNFLEKSKIISLYFSLPTNSSDFTGFEQDRYNWDFVTDFEYWKPLIEYSIEKNFQFVYVLNSPKIHNGANSDFQINLEKLHKLIINLKNLGCNKMRVSNPQLMGYLNKNYPEIELYISTSTELQTIQQYSNLFYMFKNIKEVVPSWDLNKNFRFLKNIQKKFPEIKVELMVNEGCIPACPFRNIHNNWFNTKTNNKNSNFYYSASFFKENCLRIMNQNLLLFLSASNIIYPWNIKEYENIGINKFKFVGRNNIEFRNGKYLECYEHYLKGIDNIKNIENISIRYFNNYIYKYLNFNETVKDLIKYLPDIRYFKKYGHLCAARCGVECRYCYKCAEEIQKVFNKKQEAMIKRTIPACVIRKHQV